MANIKFSAFSTGATTANTRIVGYDSTGNTNNQYTLAQLATGIQPSLSQSFIVACSDETTALTTGAAKATFRMPYAFTVTGVRASLTTAGSTSGVTTIDINEGGSSILSTLITIDQGELTSTTAATAPVISDASLADDAQMTVDIDGLSGGATEAGLKVTLIGYPTV